jgi:hypothetical protein
MDEGLTPGRNHPDRSGHPDLAPPGAVQARGVRAPPEWRLRTALREQPEGWPPVRWPPVRWPPVRQHPELAGRAVPDAVPAWRQNQAPARRVQAHPASL